MKLVGADLKLAISRLIGVEIGEAFNPPAQLEVDALADALIPVFGAPLMTVPLAWVAIYAPARTATVNLDPPDAAKHPMLRDWIEPTLGGALVAPILAGLRAWNLAPGAPQFSAVRLTRRQGSVGGAADLLFGSGEILVTAWFGSHEETGCSFTTTLSGQALLAVGEAVRPTRRPASTIAASGAAPPKRFRPPNASVH